MNTYNTNSNTNTVIKYTLGSTPGQDIPLSMERIESNRNFANKLWNAGKYLQNVLSTLSKDDVAALAVNGPLTSSELASLPLAEKYIVSTCHNLIAEVYYYHINYSPSSSSSSSSSSR